MRQPPTLAPSLNSAALLTVVAVAIGPANAGSNENFLQLQQHLSPDTADILENLSTYSKLWISVPKQRSNGHERGNCVWSECALDDQTDDAHMGDNRDGDEKWYKYRTQSFCANAAYSLFGIKKHSGSRLGGRCSAGHFINSFFTYEGADTLLKALGVTPHVYYEGYQYEGRQRGRLLEDNATETATYSNADCVQIDYQSDADSQRHQRQRHLPEDEQDQNNGYTSSLGCDSTGHYIVAAFQGKSCDGNYFLSAIDSMDDYNDQHSGIGCRNIWTDSGHSDYTTNSNYHAVYTLLKNSWACDPKLYPNECPDPYGEKGRYDYALRTAAQGGNGLLAYKSEALLKPLRTTSWVLFGLTLCVLILTYFVKNRKRAVKEGRKRKRDIAKACVRAAKENIKSGLNKTRRRGASNMEENESHASSRSTSKKGHKEDSLQEEEGAEEAIYQVMETPDGREGVVA
eukprot:CCRYP_010407-RB/>CCRYP_010407-RB protein AED:0.04 eAED:0.04 QI:357/1/1/1/0.5/0.33/3/322/457